MVFVKKKNNEHYVFLYNDKSHAEILETLGRFVSNPELSLTLCDAVELYQKIREQIRHAH